MIRFNESIDQILTESVERFTQKMGRDKDLFLAVLGHDLRNPLTTIQLGATVLLRSPAITARDHNTVETIAAAPSECVRWCTTCSISRAHAWERGCR